MSEHCEKHHWLLTEGGRFLIMGNAVIVLEINDYRKTASFNVQLFFLSIKLLSLFFVVPTTGSRPRIPTVP